jgi:hypothetical protein
MKKFFYFLLIILVILGLAFLGNILRCMTARGNACPGWCFARQAKCLNSECNTKLACRPPSWLNYIDLTKQWWNDQQAQWHN